MNWNYTKTALAILAGNLVVGAVLHSGDFLAAGGPLGAVIAASLVVVPVLIAADLIAWARGRWPGKARVLPPPSR